jgi:predicted amidohydrolase
VSSVALVQLAQDTDTEPPAERVDRAIDITRAACADADLVVLPELWLAGAFDIHASKTYAEPLDGPLVAAFSDIAAQEGTWLHMGSFPERDAEGNTFNTSVLFDSEGTIAATYRKVHLFGFDGGEPSVMSAGENYVVVDTPLGKTGLATCYDLRFPEQFRALVDAGAESFLIASGWPTKRIEHWRVLLRARAVEDLAWVVACNGVGTQVGTELGGYSAIIDPLGEVIVEADGSEQILRGGVDVEKAQQWRDTFPALGDRV